MLLTTIVAFCRQIKYWLLQNPARFFLLAAPLWLLIVYWLKKLYGQREFLGFEANSLLYEAFGMVFDLIVFGALLTWYESIREKKEKIERLHEELNDYRDWKEPEAVYRTVGILKRLIILKKIKETNFQNCFLEGANLKGLDLMEIDFAGANLKKAHLDRANFEGAFLVGVNLEGAFLQGSNLENAALDYANLVGANFTQDLSIKIIPESKSEKPWIPNFKKTNLRGVTLEGAKVGTSNWIALLKEWDVIGHDEIFDKYIVDENLEIALK